LPLFRRLRAEQEIGLEAAMRQAAFKIGGEEMWTAGQPELAAFQSLDGFSTVGLNENERAESDNALSQRDSQLRVQLDA